MAADSREKFEVAKLRYAESRRRLGHSILGATVALRFALAAILTASAVVLGGEAAHADVQREGGTLTAVVGPYTYHVSTDERFNETPWLIGLEWERPSRWASGAAFFRNSFDQPCGYLYGQKRFTWTGGEEGLFLKITVGLLYGYKPPHEHAVPFNYGGFSPGLVPIVGYKSGRATAELVIFGASSGFVAAFGYDLWK